jgi:hypothetical protein
VIVPSESEPIVCGSFGRVREDIMGANNESIALEPNFRRDALAQRMIITWSIRMVDLH